MTENTLIDLQSEAQQAISDDSRTREHGIEVVEENGVITLEGQVPSHEVKESAESVIEMVFGIKSIVNRLHIQVENLDEPLKEEAISE